MGLFDWFRSTPSNVTVQDDVIWLTAQAKLHGIARTVAQSRTERNRPDAVILVAHFRDCLEELRQIAESSPNTGTTAVAIANDLRSAAGAGMSLDESQTIQIVVGERHPLPSHDEALLEFARSLPCRCRLVHHVSLEDPLMRVFAGEWVQNTLKRLGMAENQSIESSMVASRIKEAQQKIGKECLTDFPADSAEEWMEQNCRDLWGRIDKH